MTFAAGLVDAKFGTTTKGGAPQNPAPPAAPAAMLAFARREIGSFLSPGPADLPSTMTARAQSVDAVSVQPSDTVATTPAVFSGQPSLVSMVVVAALRVVSAVINALGVDIGNQAPLIESDHPPFLLMLGLNVKRTEFDGMPVWTIDSGQPSDKVVIALHGGEFVGQPTVMHWLDYSLMARTTGATVIVPIHPLAPKGTASTVVPMLADFMTSVIDERAAANVSVIGDSAGGGLAISVAQLLVERHAATPSHMVLLSPWLDVTMSNPAIAYVNDPILNPVTLKASGLECAGALDLTDPLVSPLYGSLAGLPPTTIYSGSLDVLSPDVLVLQNKAIAQHAPFTFVLRNGEIHDWAIGPLLPEAIGVRPQIYAELFGA